MKVLTDLSVCLKTLGPSSVAEFEQESGAIPRDLAMVRVGKADLQDVQRLVGEECY